MYNKAVLEKYHKQRPTMLNLDTAILDQITAAARERVADDPRWLHAIDRAARELAENPYIERTADALLIGSPSGQTYEANGVCQCRAFQCGRPCWHRAAGRLVQRYDEVAQVQQARAAKLAAQAKAQAELDECFA
jgi:hypothetical protein